MKKASVSAITLWSCLFALIVCWMCAMPVAKAAEPEDAAPLSGFNVSIDPVLAGRLDAVLNTAVAEGRIVGAVVMAARNGQVVYARAVGMADAEEKAPMSLNTRFRLASMSKPVVSVAALALVDQGQLDLDDPVTRWLPWFTPRFGNRVEPVITVRQLLTHTAGLSYGFLQPQNGPMAAAEVSDGLDDPPISLEENLWRLATVPLFYQPGTDWKYSLAIDVLGEVLSRAGGDTLPDVVRWLVTVPLGMKSTGFVVDEPGSLAVPYVLSKGAAHRMAETELVPNGVSVARHQPARALDSKAYPSGGAGMVGTAGDYLRFLEAMRNDGASVLKPETARSLAVDQIGPQFAQSEDKSLQARSPEVVAPGWGFGFGGAVLLNPGKAAYPAGRGTWSWSGAYGTHFFMDRANGISFVALTNTTPEGMAGPFATALDNAVYGR